MLRAQIRKDACEGVGEGKVVCSENQAKIDQPPSLRKFASCHFSGRASRLLVMGGLCAEAPFLQPR